MKNLSLADVKEGVTSEKRDRYLPGPGAIQSGCHQVDQVAHSCPPGTTVSLMDGHTTVLRAQRSLTVLQRAAPKHLMYENYPAKWGTMSGNKKGKSELALREKDEMNLPGWYNSASPISKTSLKMSFQTDIHTVEPSLVGKPQIQSTLDGRKKAFH